jgi:large subunit ribosomal protein L21
MKAVVKTGGKQYLVEEGSNLTVEKLAGKTGDKVILEDVLMVSDGKKVSVGAPKVEGAKVEAIIEAQKRADKVTTVKFKSKTRYRRKIGHRQQQTELKIEKITA